MLLTKTNHYSRSVGVKIEQRVHNEIIEFSFNALSFLLYIVLTPQSKHKLHLEKMIILNFGLIKEEKLLNVLGIKLLGLGFFITLISVRCSMKEYFKSLCDKV